jgi:hypothetical protein
VGCGCAGVDLCCSGLESIRAAPEQDDVETVKGKPLGDGAADSGAATGDDRHRGFSAVQFWARHRVLRSGAREPGFLH